MSSYDSIKEHLLNLKLIAQKAQIKKYSGVALLEISREPKIAAEIQAIIREIGTANLNPEQKRKLVPVREKLSQMLTTDQLIFATVNNLTQRL